MTRVKICGINDVAYALAVIKAGGDFMGLVFAPSQRQVTLAQAEEIVNLVREHSDIAVVGVFVNLPATEVNMLATACHLDWVQLSGDESWEYCLGINQPVIKVVRVERGQHLEEICDYLTQGDRILSDKKHRYLIDSRVRGQYGGTGITTDWGLAGEIAQRFPIILAGGLTPENVARAIDTVTPWGVDVSSGVEVNGVKNIAKIRNFISAVRRTDDSKR
ncbi:MAG: phosphoribosylanthranilate isomerase [Dehalococcoidales bacterium]|nr:phosphoribosylanthranilate isomerase [Dehalococcoidales bacterium]